MSYVHENKLDYIVLVRAAGYPFLCPSRWTNTIHPAMYGLTAATGNNLPVPEIFCAIFQGHQTVYNISARSTVSDWALYSLEHIVENNHLLRSPIFRGR